MRRLVVPLILVAIAIALFFVLRERKRQFIAAQVALLQSEDPTKSESARKVLQRVGRAAVRPLCELLEHPQARVRRVAALTLANIGDPAAAGPLMQAARRGDFPAADALKAMKHPRCSEARAWAYCWLADRKLRELRAGLPVGGRPELLPMVRWPVPYMYRPFDGASELIQKEPEPRYCPGYRRWDWTIQAPNEADAWYELAEHYGPLPEAAIARARLHELCGDYGGASLYYERALRLAPSSRTARTGEARAQRLLVMAGRMQRMLPEGQHVEHILTHPTWTRGDATCYVAVATPHLTRLDLGTDIPTLLLFRQTAERLERLHALPVFSVREEARARKAVWQVLPSAYVGVAEPDQHAGAALLAVVRGQMTKRDYVHRWDWTYDVALYRLGNDTLANALQLPSTLMPWVADVDEDGDAEIVTWRWVTFDYGGSGPWPIVRTLVNGRYEARTEQFPSVFEGVPSVLDDVEPGEDDPDPKFPDYAGRAYEILGQREFAIEAYLVAERKYRERADHVAAQGRSDQARLHRQAAEAVKARRLRLEATNAPEGAEKRSTR